MWEIQLLIIGAILGWIIRSIVEAVKMQRMLTRVMRDIQTIELTERILDRVFKQCYVEQEGNTFYLYDNETSAFLCQGNSFEDLATCLHKQHNIQVALVQGLDKKNHLWFDHGNVKPVKVIK
jgi:hypothetical protein